TGPAFAAVDAAYPGLEASRRRHEAMRRVFGVMVEDVIATARAALAEAAPDSAEAVRALPAPVVRFSAPLTRDIATVKAFLFQRMYRAPSVVIERRRVTAVLEGLFPLYLAEPSLMPPEWQAEARGADATRLARVVVDYVAGMTDRFALAEYRRLIGE